MGMFEEEEKIEPEKTDDFNDIRKQYEQAELEESLKSVLFGGYSKKKVNETINTYKEMINWMQGNFDYRLQELNAEKERICNERVVLKRQLNEELEKNKRLEGLEEEAERYKRLSEELILKYEDAKEDLRVTTEEKEALMRQCRLVEKRLGELERELEELRAQASSPEANANIHADTGENPALIVTLTRQLEEITSYCETMENQQRSLETQISSMKNIGQELEKLSLQYEENQSELKEVRKKYTNAKNENHALNSEMESTSQILAEILEQFEEKEKENDLLRRAMSDVQEQLMTVKKEKLASEQANLGYMEQAYRAEKATRESEEELRRVKKELEELQRQYKSLENSKVIKLQNTLETEKEDVPEKERIDELLKRASAVTARAGEQEEAKKAELDTVKITNDKEVL